MLVNYNSSVASGLAKVEQIRAQFAKNGTHVEFSFGRSDSVPKKLAFPKIDAANYIPALSLNINIQ